MSKFLKAFLLSIILTVSVFNNTFSMTEEEKKEYVYIDFYNFISSYNVFDRKVVTGKFFNKTIDVTSTFFVNYIIPADKYVTTLQYRGAPRRVNIFEKPFLLDWFKYASESATYRQNNSAEAILADENFDLFYRAVLYSARGRTYFITTQSALSEKMANELRIGDTIQVFMLNLGQSSNDIPTFLIVGYEKMGDNARKSSEEGVMFEEYFASIKSDFENRRFDKAKGRLEMILKNYPNNIEAKLNLCLVQSKTNFYSAAISCYNDILKVDPKNYDALYGLAMTHYLNSGPARSKAANVIKFTTQSIEEINKITNVPRGSLAIIYYNAYFLRGLAKVDINDKTAIEDFYIVHSQQPTLISTDALNYYKQILKVN